MKCEFGKRSKPFKDGKTFIVDDDVDLTGYSFSLSRGYVIFSGTKDGLCGKYIHRWIMGFPDGFEIDHKNNDPLDNRRCNLRVCSHQENMFNRLINKNNKSGFKGVSFYKSTNKYRSQISINKKIKTIGYFETAEEAHEAYCKKAQELYGEYYNSG